LGIILSNLTAQPVIKEQDMMKMLRSIGMRVSLVDFLQLSGKIREFNEKSDGFMDFVCFLRVVRWMLDTNYAGVLGAAERAAERT